MYAYVNFVLYSVFPTKTVHSFQPCVLHTPPTLFS